MKSFSCSTMWNIRSHENALDALKEMTSIGFERVELNYLVTEKMFEQMLPWIEAGNISVSSVHNVFPKAYNPEYGTDSPFMGFLDEEKRKEAVRLSMVSADYAHRLGASALVLHVGEVVLEYDYNKALSNMYRSSMKGSAEYEKLLTDFKLRRAQAAPEALRRVEKSLLELSEYIIKKQYKIKLGVENRAQIQQIPTLDEACVLLDRLKDAPCGFWYDTGHGMIMENIGLFPVFPNIYKLKERIIGMHIHDAEGIDDHFQPYAFGNGFDKYLEFIKASPTVVFEIGPKCSKEDVKRSLEKIRYDTSSQSTQ